MKGSMIVSIIAPYLIMSFVTLETNPFLWAESYRLAWCLVSPLLATAFNLLQAWEARQIGAIRLLEAQKAAMDAYVMERMKENTEVKQ